MFSLGESLTDNTKILLIKPEEIKKKSLFGFFRQQAGERRIFRKDFNHAEFVGEELCNMRNLRCAHFFLVGEGYYKVNRMAPFKEIEGDGYRLLLGSYDFRNPVEYDYFQIKDESIRSSHNYLDELLDLAPNENNRRELLDDVEEMFAIDTYMGQTDRYWNNIIFEKNKRTGEIRLAPLYDFEYSLNPMSLDPDMIYDNALHTFKTEDDYIEFIQQHPEFADKLRFYLKVDLMETMQRVYRAKGLKVPLNTIPYYLDFEKGRKDLIRKVVGMETTKVK